MSSPSTDRFGYPLTAAQVAARLNSPRSRGYYVSSGRWVRLTGTAKRTPPVPKAEEKK